MTGFRPVPFTHIAATMFMATTRPSFDPAAVARRGGLIPLPSIYWGQYKLDAFVEEMEVSSLFERAGVNPKADHCPHASLTGMRFCYRISGTTATLSGVSVGYGATRMEAARNMLGKYLHEGAPEKRIAVALALGLELRDAAKFGGQGK